MSDQDMKAAMGRDGENHRNPVPRRNEDRAAVADLDGPLAKKLATLMMSAQALCPLHLSHPEKIKWQAEHLLRNATRNRVGIATLPVYETEWARCKSISEVEAVDETIRGFEEDPTEDNAVCMVRQIIQTAAAFPGVKN